MTGSWWHDAACANADLDIFFPIGSQPGRYKDALAICATCPVTTQCLEDAIGMGSFHGVYGGTTPYQRLLIATRRGIIKRQHTGHGDKPGTLAGYYREKYAGTEHCEDCIAAYNKRSATDRERKRKVRANVVQ